MTKYIDRYYLNGEMYAIKFPEQGWRPGANTIAYYPLDSTNTVNDLSGNNYNLTNNGIVFGTYGGIDCAYFNGSSAGNNTSINKNISGVTICFRVNVIETRQHLFAFIQDTVNDKVYQSRTSESYTNKIAHLFFNSNGWTFYGYDNSTITNNSWFLVTGVADTSSNKIYINGNLVGMSYKTGTSSSGIVAYTINKINAGGVPTVYCKCYMSRLIFENEARTATEISDYYNQTKSLYGIS